MSKNAKELELIKAELRDLGCKYEGTYTTLKAKLNGVKNGTRIPDDEFEGLKELFSGANAITDDEYYGYLSDTLMEVENSSMNLFINIAEKHVNRDKAIEIAKSSIRSIVNQTEIKNARIETFRRKYNYNEVEKKYLEKDGKKCVIIPDYDKKTLDTLSTALTTDNTLKTVDYIYIVYPPKGFTYKSVPIFNFIKSHQDKIEVYGSSN